MAHEDCPNCGTTKHVLVACPKCGFHRLKLYSHDRLPSRALGQPGNPTDVTEAVSGNRGKIIRSCEAGSCRQTQNHPGYNKDSGYLRCKARKNGGSVTEAEIHKKRRPSQQFERSFSNPSRIVVLPTNCTARASHRVTVSPAVTMVCGPPDKAHSCRETSSIAHLAICPVCGADGGIHDGCFKCGGTGWIPSSEMM